MKPIHHILSRSERQTVRLGCALGRCLEAGHVVGLVGDLGAGKTCLARGVARGLEVDPRVHVSSPTFTLVNEYPGRITLYHIDLYRLQAPEELYELGLQEYCGGDGVCLVEWFDRFPRAVPGEHLLVRLGLTGRDDQRTMAVSAAGERHLLLARRWLRPAGAQDGGPLTSGAAAPS